MLRNLKPKEIAEDFSNFHDMAIPKLIIFPPIPFDFEYSISNNKVDTEFTRSYKVDSIDNAKKTLYWLKVKTEIITIISVDESKEMYLSLTAK